MITATRKRVISIIALSIMICMCYFMISGSVYASKNNQDKFNKDYTLTGNGADDIVAVAYAQWDTLVEDLGYDQYDKLATYQFIADCAELAGQEKAVPNDMNMDFLFDNIIRAGGKELNRNEDLKPGDIAFWDDTKHGSYHCAGIYINSGFMMSKYLDKIVMLDSTILDYQATSIHIVRPNYQNSPSLPDSLVVKGKTIKVSYFKLKKRSQSFKVSKALSISDYQDGLTFKKLKGNKRITINKRTGEVTVKKNLKKKTYKVTVEVTTEGADGTAPLAAEATFKVRIR